jgi:hypothetical protein
LDRAYIAPDNNATLRCIRSLVSRITTESKGARDLSDPCRHRYSHLSHGAVKYAYLSLNPTEVGVNMFFWLIVGVAAGYFFKPQIDVVVKKAVRMLKDNRNENDDYKQDQ